MTNAYLFWPEILYIRFSRKSCRSALKKGYLSRLVRREASKISKNRKNLVFTVSKEAICQDKLRKTLSKLRNQWIRYKIWLLKRRSGDENLDKTGVKRRSLQDLWKERWSAFVDISSILVYNALVYVLMEFRGHT